MATTSNPNFSAMVNRYLAFDMLKEELFQRDYFLSKVKKDNNWKGGPIVLPFRASNASSVAFGGLIPESEINSDLYVRAEEPNMREVWGSLKFNHKDLITFDGKVSEQSFLRILPDAVEDFINTMKTVVSLNMLNGKYFAKVTTNGSAVNGTIGVDHVERFALGQKVGIRGVVEGMTYFLIDKIDMDGNTVKIKNLDGTAHNDASVYTTADQAKFYFQGSETEGLISLKGALLSAANGGTPDLHGVADKSLYPFTQAVNISGATMSKTSILDDIFNAFTTIRQKGKGNPQAIIMSYKHLGSIMKLLEAGKGAYNLIPGSTKVNVYGYTTIQIFGVKGTLEVVGVQEIDDDFMLILDWDGFTLFSNGFFRKRVNPDGDSWYESRQTTGYYYILDISFFGQLIISRPSAQGIIFNIPNYAV